MGEGFVLLLAVAVIIGGYFMIAEQSTEDGGFMKRLNSVAFGEGGQENFLRPFIVYPAPLVAGFLVAIVGLSITEDEVSDEDRERWARKAREKSYGRCSGCGEYCTLIAPSYTRCVDCYR